MSAQPEDTRKKGTIFEAIGNIIKRPESLAELRAEHPKFGLLLICLGGLATSRMVTMAFDATRTLLVPWIWGSCSAPSSCYSILIVILSILYFLLCPLLPAIFLVRKVAGISVKNQYVHLLGSLSIHYPLWYLPPLLVFQLLLQFPFQGGAFATVFWSIFFAFATLDSWSIVGKIFKIRGASRLQGFFWAVFSSLIGAGIVLGITYLLGGLS